MSDPSCDGQNRTTDTGCLPSPKHPYRPEVDVSGVNQSALLRRIDLHVIPWLILLYLLSFLDRGSIGNARLYGFQDDIAINDDQYLIALTVFFFPYSLVEPMSNVILKRLRPSIWLSSMIFLWGIVMTLHGTIRDYGSLITLRTLLGLFEAGMYPGIVFYISSWYTKAELGSRVAVFFSAATLAGAFSGLLAAAIATMDGIAGKPGWAWIFILEGIVTVVVAIASFWAIHDFPDTATFLSEEERVFIIRRLQEDSKFSAAGESFQMNYIWRSLYDPKTWFAMGITMGLDGPLYAFSLFLPSIIGQACYRATEANLLSVPVYAWGCILTCAVGFLGDRIGTRYHLNLVLLCVGEQDAIYTDQDTDVTLKGLVAYIILIVSRSSAVSYFAVYLAVSAIFPTIPNTV
ncbi:hypothetical protein AX16_006467 [Volvariella volvacea WC 439]|nr:hypothetical protein AX16_006467 [Volvariella volvacea WC 439]